MSFSVLDAAKSRTSIPGLAHCRLIIILATFSCFSLLSQAEPNSSAQLAWHTVGILGGIALKLRNADCCIPKVLAAGCNYCATGQPAYPYPDHAGLAFSVVKAGSIILGVVLGRELGHLICTPKRAGLPADESQAILHYLCVYLGAYLGAKGAYCELSDGQPLLPADIDRLLKDL